MFAEASTSKVVVVRAQPQWIVYGYACALLANSDRGGDVVKISRPGGAGPGGRSFFPRTRNSRARENFSWEVLYRERNDGAFSAAFASE